MLTDANRTRLIAILGMLGSSSAGERNNAAAQAERLRQRLGTTWEDLLADRVVHVDRFIPPPPTAPVREVYVVQQAPPVELFGMPPWGFAIWCCMLGLVLGSWVGFSAGMCH